MTNNEFKAWFEGFSEGIVNKPTYEQWAKVVAKVKTIDNIPLFPQVVYRDRYIPYYSTMGAVATTARSTLYNLGRQEAGLK